MTIGRVKFDIDLLMEYHHKFEAIFEQRGQKLALIVLNQEISHELDFFLSIWRYGKLECRISSIRLGAHCDNIAKLKVCADGGADRLLRFCDKHRELTHHRLVSFTFITRLLAS